jgi:catechol 2,3-dioxygenase
MNPEIFHAPDHLRLGEVTLNVRDLDRMVNFYTSLLGFDILISDDKKITLGFEHNQPLVSLEHYADAALRPKNAAGLYHFAFLSPSRKMLAQAFRELIRVGYPLQGAADHYVSEAIYLADPEGNGIEIYTDRAREMWQWNGDQVRIGTVPLDVDSLLGLAQDSDDIVGVLSKGTVMGHMHLQVTDLEEAMSFYGDILGFDSMGRYGTSAAFYSTGGYHHHIGLNTWASAGGPKAEAGMLGLKRFEIIYPRDGAFEGLIHSLSTLKLAFTQNGNSIKIEDPSGITMIIRKEKESEASDPVRS